MTDHVVASSSFDPGPVGPTFWARSAAQLVVDPLAMSEVQRAETVRYLWDRQFRSS
ncbi:hypothetical protein [Candidatus Mycolicibacterium alkanivorans]|uniref:Uncharacterized protein n=1 Tax=Candidatus Mycolicibacterium alkanivorans TaxID=2954114 RepID=A0ABS9YUI3_9MYCO|nr:hypothetical protein [Candidatus Mycolicibacterium alkanivorans]MCI4674783.1 hypothetical protein [Candidatus Mycolicibacterium alkanivorans]